MPVPPEDMSMVSPATSRPSGSLAITGVTILMRTVVRNCLISRATAVVTPRIITLNTHQGTSAQVPDFAVTKKAKQFSGAIWVKVLESGTCWLHL
jgi:hypothetical protein